ncbi:MAG: YHS domain protein [Bacteroidetes bacterium]|nr:YHS domain protein [Bacteroidota bacterium]
MKPIIQFLSLLLLINSVAFGQQNISEKRKSQFNITEGVAIMGYDPVAYFVKSKAVKGSKQFAVRAEGITYYCSSEENKQLLVKNYQKYEPQYGGWCAFAMGNSGDKVEVDPETFKIIDGKLFLFYNAYFNNTLKSWNKDEINLKKQADKNWSKFYTMP